MQREDAVVEARELGIEQDLAELRRLDVAVVGGWPGPGSGTTNFAITNAAAVRARPVMAKIPGTPIQRSSTGPSTIETANMTPMVVPMIAIALVRCSSRVRSAASAIDRRGDRAGALEHAPEDHDPDVRRIAAMKLPTREQRKPDVDHALAADSGRTASRRESGGWPG